MNRWVSSFAVLVIFAVCGLGSASAQKEPRPGTVIVPPTNSERAEDVGIRSHTNFLIFVPAAKKGSAHPYFGGTSPGGETPGSLACIYQTVTYSNNVSPACAISSATTVPSGGSKVIAIVDAYDYPTAKQDFDTFSNQFGLPLSTDTCGNGPCFTKVYAANSQPRSNCGWAQEEALDIEWAHAMAPHAQIILVEAASNSNADLMSAVQKATGLVAGAGGGEVSMSWGSNEFSGESNYDSDFKGSGVTYVASSGDSGGKVIWPSASPNVVSAGGTTVNRDGSGNFTDETTWSSAGGGPSKIEPYPAYQSGIGSLANLLQGFRGTPDISFDANPYTGVSVYDSTRCQGMSGWLVFGGTSVSAPSLSGIFNLSGDFSGNNSVQTNLYGNYSSVSSAGTSSYSPNGGFFDVTSSSPATPDWDFASGIGTLRGTGGLAASSTTSSPSFSLSATSPSGSLTQGSTTTTVTSNISMTTSGNFSGTVDLATNAANYGLEVVSINPSSISGTETSTLTLGAGTATAGTYTVTISGSGKDSSNNTLTSSTTVQVTVNPASSGSGSFSLSATPGNVTLHGGGTAATYSITVTPSGGFNQTVSFAVTAGAPKNSTISFYPQTLPGSGSTTLSVTPPSSTPRGSYTLTIRGTASGGSSQSVSVGLKLR